MLKLKGKRLLILAANEETKKFVRRAQELGIYTIVTDHIKNSPAKAIADKSYDINGKFVEEVVQMALKEKIDGVIVGVADPLVPSYLEVANRLGLPCYISEENRDFFVNKKFFKHMCSVSGFHTVKEFYSGKDWRCVEQNSLEYPCIVKPVLGRGGKGVFLCKNIEELEKAFYIAQTCSDNAEVIIEAYMNCMDISASYFFCDGTAHLLGISDRKVLSGKTAISPVTYGNVYPSSLTDIFIKQCHDKFLALFEKIEIYNGILTMQIFWDGENFYPYDPACILGGEMSSSILPEIMGIDLIDHFLIYSLTGNMNCFQVPSDGGIIPGGGCVESIWILLKPGVIGRVEGINGIGEIQGVLECLQRLHEGDVVSEDMFETEKSTFARIWAKANNCDELSRLVKMIRNRIKVFDENDEVMIWEGK